MVFEWTTITTLMLQMIKYLFGYEDVAFRFQELFKDLKYQVGQDPHRLYCLRDWDRIW
jgi:hypothetical protein